MKQFTVPVNEPKFFGWRRKKLTRCFDLKPWHEALTMMRTSVAFFLRQGGPDSTGFVCLSSEARKRPDLSWSGKKTESGNRANLSKIRREWKICRDFCCLFFRLGIGPDSTGNSSRFQTSVAFLQRHKIRQEWGAIDRLTWKGSFYPTKFRPLS